VSETHTLTATGRCSRPSLSLTLSAQCPPLSHTITHSIVTAIIVLFDRCCCWCYHRSLLAMSARLQRRAELDSASLAAEALIDGRIATSTKKRYLTAIRVMQEYWTAQLGRTFAVPVDKDTIVSFFGWLIETKYKEKPAAFSTIRLYKSALASLYKERSIILHPDTNQRLESLLNGYSRRIAELRMTGRMAVFEGKLHLTFEGYRLLAGALFIATPSFMLFAWPYLLLQWNLMARAKSVASLMMEHVGWEGDALLVTLPKHKGDQEGANVFARHLYANNADPIICPVLALAVTVFTRVLRFDPDGDTEANAASLPSSTVGGLEERAGHSQHS
jgi:hypothetical protein